MFCIIQISLTLLVIVAGMFLLAKAQKDNLNTLYKAIAYGVITVGFVTFLCAVGCALCSSKCYKGGEKNCGMYSNGCQSGGGQCQMNTNGCQYGSGRCMSQMSGCNQRMMGCPHGMEMGDCQKKCSKMEGWNDEDEEDEAGEGTDESKEATPVKPEDKEKK